MTALIEAPWLLALAVAAALSAVSAAGCYLAQVTRINADSHQHEQIKGLRDGLFVLVGLLLGFTIALALPKFDQRRQLEIQEANSIGTTRLRAESLPSRNGPGRSELLREYAGVRRQYGKVRTRSRKLDSSIQRTKELHGQIWQQLVPVARQNKRRSSRRTWCRSTKRLTLPRAGSPLLRTVFRMLCG
jgi:hypothetical protein